jgi:hypothetical protein
VFVNKALAVVGVVAIGACSVPVSPECEQYVACAEYYYATLEIDGEADVEAYVEGGDCWRSAEVADVCSTQCTDTTTAMATALDVSGEEMGPCNEEP